MLDSHAGMENPESNGLKTVGKVSPTNQDLSYGLPITATQAQGLFAAGEAHFRPGSKDVRCWVPPTLTDLQRALPQYEIAELVGRGGMGAVYRGVQRSLARTVAIKVLPAEAAANDFRFADRFINEARAMARLDHPNIVAVHDAGETEDGLLYFVMEFVEGRDLARITDEGRLPPLRVLEIAASICDALTFAHEEGIIHRDIKPSNIMLDNRGRVKVADFGLAKATDPDATLLTQSDTALGTPEFVAPELSIPGSKVDHRADIYGLGVTLYVLLTGQVPRGRFQPPSQFIPQIDPRLDAIIDRALQSSPDKRYSSAADMRRALEQMTCRGSKVGKPFRAVRRWPLWIRAAISLLMLAVLAALAGRPRNSTGTAESTSTPLVSAPAAMPVPKRSPRNSPGGKAEAVWEARWHKPGKLRAAGTDMRGKAFDLTAAEPFADFVDVVILDRGTFGDVTWVGLRSNGKVVWSNGTLEPGRIGIVRSWADVVPIHYGGRAGVSSVAPPEEPVTDFCFARMLFLAGKPTAIAWADVAGQWHVRSPAIDSGLMPAPDLVTLPKVTEVVVDGGGIGVLREDGSLRIWNRLELKLPDSLAKEIVSVVPMGSSWAVLKRSGQVLNFAMLRTGAGSAEPLAEVPTIREFLDSKDAAMAVASGGYSPLVKRQDGRWTTDESLDLINDVLARLHRQKNESFSAFHSLGRQGILWIEPVE